MVLIIGVRFRKSGKVYYFDPLDLDIKKNDHVIVETARGVEYGTVVLAPKEVEKEKIVQPLKPVMRIATPQDDATSIENEKKEKEAYNICLEKITKHNLEMKLIDSAKESESMAQKVKDTNGCYVVPAFTGLGAPHWDQYARGTIVGITRGVNRYHIIRATLESLAYQVHEVLEAMKADSGISIPALKVDGGASANNFLMQVQADIMNAPVIRPRCVETTAMGAAYLAGLAVSYWADKEDVVKNWQKDESFVPEITEEEREKRIKGWNKAVKYSYEWAKEE